MNKTFSMKTERGDFFFQSKQKDHLVLVNPTSRKKLRIYYQNNILSKVEEIKGCEMSYRQITKELNDKLVIFRTLRHGQQRSAIGIVRNVMIEGAVRSFEIGDQRMYFGPFSYFEIIDMRSI